MPLLGRREQALGQERQRLGEDRQLAGPGVAERPVDADQVAQVELGREAPAGLADLVLADEDQEMKHGTFVGQRNTLVTKCPSKFTDRTVKE